MGYLEMLQLLEIMSRNSTSIKKARIYLKRGKKPPKGAVVHRGAEGGIWYESGRGSPSEGFNQRRMEEKGERHSGTYTQSQLDHENRLHRPAVRHAFNKVKENMLGDPDHYGSPIHSHKALKNLVSVVTPYKNIKDYGDGDTLINELEGEISAIDTSHQPEDHTYYHVLTDFKRHYEDHLRKNDRTSSSGYKHSKKIFHNNFRDAVNKLSLDD